MVERVSYLPAYKKHFSAGKNSPGARGEITLITAHLLLSGILMSALLQRGDLPAAAGSDEEQQCAAPSLTLLSSSLKPHKQPCRVTI